MRVGYQYGHQDVTTRWLDKIEPVIDAGGLTTLKVTFKGEPGVDNGKAMHFVGTYWSNGLLVFYAPEDW